MNAIPNLSHFTLTGVDEKTSLADIDLISHEFPLVEWGILYSPSRQGLPGRYPSIEFITKALTSLPDHVRVALHICGGGAHRLIDYCTVEKNLVDLVAARNGRVQMNFNQHRHPIDMDGFMDLLCDYPDTTFITQDNKANVDLWRSVTRQGDNNHAVLFDSSGGRGISRSEWPKPYPIRCGYAGGLGPDNIQSELASIADVAGERDAWVDMEGKLRTANLADGVDYFDLDTCRKCLNEGYSFLTKTAFNDNR